MRWRLAILLSIALSGCSTVRQEDLDAWAGRPVSDLDLHPLFATMKVVRTMTPDGTEIRNYVNSKEMMVCGSSGSAAPGLKPPGYSPISTGINYSQSVMCTGTTPTCNNLFYIKDGRVLRYTPVGSGGARCFTNDMTKPDFRGAGNY